MRILINNIDFTIDADLSGIQITSGLNESDNTIDVVSTNTIKVTGKARDYLHDIFFKDKCKGKRSKVDIKIYDSCCKIWFEFEATATGTKECGCDIEFVLRGKDKANCYNKLKSKLYWDNGFKDAYKHPQVWYVNRPPGTMALFALSVTVSTIGVLILGICKALNKVIEFVTIGIGGIDCSPIEDLLCDFSELITGTNWKSPAPYIRNILEYNAKLCGLKLKSSIFQNSIYKDAVLFQQQYTRGLKNARNWIEDNGANLTVLQLLDMLKTEFNLDYRIQVDCLVVERKDFFDTPKNGIIADIRKESYCVSIDTSLNYASGQFSHADDALDQDGNGMYRDYDDRVEWNTENSEWKKGVHTVQSDFGRARFMFDQKTFEQDGNFDMDMAYDMLAKRGIALLRALGLCKNGATFRDNDLIITNHTLQKLKILILEPNTNLDDAKIIKRPYKKRNIDFFGFKFSSVQTWEYNWPMWFKESEPNGLYQNFHYIDNPNLNYGKIVELEDVEIEYDCDLVRKIIADPTSYGVQTREGVAIPKAWVFDLNSQKVRLSGMKLRCK